jgi:2-polyprenyl-6-methoxyphenol hydroxylase-like FAD-dependent oxidoreductase
MVPPVAPWPPGPVTLLGDAVHAAPGFGATLALQDALRLRDALVRADRDQQGLAAAIGEHEHLMRQEGMAALDAFRGAA